MNFHFDQNNYADAVAAFHRWHAGGRLASRPGIRAYVKAQIRRGAQALNRRQQPLPAAPDLSQILAAARAQLQAGNKPTLVYFVPFSLGQFQSGGAKRVLGVCQALATRHQVCLVAVSKTGLPPARQSLAPDIQFITTPMTPEFNAASFSAASGAGLLKVADGIHLLPDLQRVLAAVSHEASAWACTAPGAGPVVAAFRQPSQALYYDAHDNSRDFITTAFGCQDPEFIARIVGIEDELLTQATVASFTTPEDLQAAQARVPAAADRMQCVPNGIDVNDAWFNPPEQVLVNRRRAGLTQPGVLFIGADHRPNYEAAAVMVSELAPRHPAALFVVVGMHLAGYLAFGGPAPGANVVFTGPVEETTKKELLALADVAVAPLASGSGSSLKVPEYAASGKVIIGTSTGLRGFAELTQFRSIVMSHDVAAALATELAAVQRAPAEYTAPCTAARAWVQHHLDWTTNLQPILAALAP